MKRPPVVALLTRGPLDRELLASLPALRANLAYVVAASLRHASRIANLLDGGEPADSFESVADARLLLICAEEKYLPRMLAELAEARLDWPTKALALLGGTMGTEDLREFSERGASVASLAPLAPTFGRFVIEGDELAVQFIRDHVIGRNVKVLRILKSRKHLYTAGMSFVTSLLTPHADAAVECLRSTGVPLKDAVAIINAWVEQAMRAYVKAGKKGWSGPLAVEGARGVVRQTKAVSELDARLARYFRTNAEHALSVFRPVRRTGATAAAAD